VLANEARMVVKIAKVEDARCLVVTTTPDKNGVFLFKVMGCG
jgi:hypothetical protein